MTNIGRYLSSEPNNFYHDGKEKGSKEKDKEETLIFSLILSKCPAQCGVFLFSAGAGWRGVRLWKMAQNTFFGCVFSCGTAVSRDVPTGYTLSSSITN